MLSQIVIEEELHDKTIAHHVRVIFDKYTGKVPFMELVEYFQNRFGYNLVIPIVNEANKHKISRIPEWFGFAETFGQFSPEVQARINGGRLYKVEEGFVYRD